MAYGRKRFKYKDERIDIDIYSFSFSSREETPLYIVTIKNINVQNTNLHLDTLMPTPYISLVV